MFSAPSLTGSDRLQGVGLFLQLAAQHGDDFERIASPMPHKVRSVGVDGKLY